MPKLFTFEARDAATIRDSMLRVKRNGLIALGIANPNVGPGSDDYAHFSALASELEVVEANAIVKADAQMPDSAEGDDLYRQAAMHGLYLKGAAGSKGVGTLTTAATTTIPTGAELVDDSGLRFRLVEGGVFANGAQLKIEAIDKGAATNHAEGDVLRWQSAPPFADEKVVIGAGGLQYGHDAEDDEGLRQRFLAVLRTPPRSGNWEHVAELAEQSDAAVTKAFVYPALQGPATVHIAVVAAPTATSKLRDVAASTLNASVAPFVAGQLPEHTHVVTTSVVNVATDLSIMLSLPEAQTASPPGPGGGWLDGTPWPDVGAGAGTRVTAVTSSTQITVNAQIAPTVGVSRVSWISASDWIVRTARVTASSGVAGAYVVTLDAPFAGIAVSDFVWPACENAQAYLDAVLAHFALMGPGEKTDNVSALVRGYRRPVPATSWPYGLGAQLLRDLVHSQAEIASALYLYRSDGTNTYSTPTGVLNPVPPASVTDPPKIYVPNRIGFYRLT